MRDFHFSLRWLFGLVSFLAVGCGLLVYATPLLSALTFTAAIVVLLSAGLIAACHRGKQRMVWASFAIFGLAYFWLICGSWQSPDGNSLLRDRLATTALLQWCHEKAPRNQSTLAIVQSPAGAMMGSGGMDPMMPGGMAGMPGGMGGMPGAPTMMNVASAPDWGVFMTTGHSLFALAFASFGGFIANRCRRKEKDEPI
jgi:hypothetical protein